MDELFQKQWSAVHSATLENGKKLSVLDPLIEKMLHVARAQVDRVEKFSAEFNSLSELKGTLDGLRSLCDTVKDRVEKIEISLTKEYREMREAELLKWKQDATLNEMKYEESLSKDIRQLELKVLEKEKVMKKRNALEKQKQDLVQEKKLEEEEKERALLLEAQAKQELKHYREHGVVSVPDDDEMNEEEQNANENLNDVQIDASPDDMRKLEEFYDDDTS